MRSATHLRIGTLAVRRRLRRRWTDAGAAASNLACAAPARFSVSANDLQLRGVTEGREVEPGAGEEALDEAGLVLHVPEPGLGERGELGDVALGEVGQGAFQVGPDGHDNSTGLSSEA